jgi:phosphoglycerate dehydrogenase-like enzyme
VRHVEKPLVCVALALPDEALATLAGACEPRPVVADTIASQIAEAEGLLCPAPFPVLPALLDLAPHLRVVSNFGVGFNNVDLAEMNRRGIAVCNTPGVLTDAVADLTIGMIVAASRGLVVNANYVRERRWGRDVAPSLGWDLRGKTLGLIGFGRIGKAVAARARAFGMKTCFFDLFDAPGEGWDDCAYEALDALLRASDVVSVHTNLTPETFHLLSEREFAQMKSSAWVINTSRGPVIDQAALTKALREHRIAGAILDVLEVEPPPADEPILGLENAVILPHIGSATVETRAAMLDLSIRNLKAVLAGERPPECVNPEALDRAMQRR